MDANKNITIVSNYAASGTLQTQIEQGATCDVFISAAAKQMNNLETGGLILSDTRINLLKTALYSLLIKTVRWISDSFEDLTGENVKLISVGDPPLYLPEPMPTSCSTFWVLLKR